MRIELNLIESSLSHHYHQNCEVMNC